MAVETTELDQARDAVQAAMGQTTSSPEEINQPAVAADLPTDNGVEDLPDIQIDPD